MTNPRESQLTLDGRTVEPKREPRHQRPEPDGARQLALIGHLQDNPNQRTMWEEP